MVLIKILDSLKILNIKNKYFKFKKPNLTL